MKTWAGIRLGSVGQSAIQLLAVACFAFVGFSQATGAQPIAFSFSVPSDPRAPLSREIWAEVVLPSQKKLRLPAFYSGDLQFTVHARADEPGTYHLEKITERVGLNEITLPVAGVAEKAVAAEKVASRLAIQINGSVLPGRFVFANGQPYTPLGMNLAWAPQDGIAWYKDAFDRFSKAHLNWARVWMCHWGELNLDWLPKEHVSPRPGLLDSTVAENWDALLAEAEEQGVYLQIVLQHHGQFSSGVNPNWNENPWNAANPGGFLRKPGEFFTSPKAAELTKQKYRYIVARWGYSPAVLAWELFNEVHWVDAYRIDHNEAAVAKWHDEMAAYIRSVDVYHHLVTTSTEDLRSAIYRSMDYYQPHLYATNMLAASRRFDVAPEALGKPVFYGEMGNDHMRVTEEQKAAAVEHVPIVWSSVMGLGRYPAQIWEGDKILVVNRIAELGALARFLESTQLCARDGLKEFSVVVESSASTNLRVEGGENWRRRPPPDVVVAMDGRESPEYGTIPRFLVGAKRSIAEGYPKAVTFHVDYPSAATAVLRIADAGPKGAKVRVLVDGKSVGEHAWPALRTKRAETAEARPSELSFTVTPGRHTFTIENVGSKDWIDFDSLDFGLPTSALAAVGKRTRDFIALWVWQRAGVFAIDSPRAVVGTVLVDNVEAGRWNAVWWDTISGVPAPAVELSHPGGTLKVASPPIGRHAALVLMALKSER